MSEAKQIKPMQAWAILNPERYIKKSINDWSLAIYDEKKSADRQIKSISEANDEDCFIEELAICSKVKFDEYIAVNNEMYEMLETILYNFEVGNSDHFEVNDSMIPEIKKSLAKARGEQDD